MARFHLYGGPATGAPTLSYLHRPEGETFPPYRHWPVMYAPSPSALIKFISRLCKQIPGASLILPERFVQSLKLEASRTDDPVVMLFGIDCIRPAGDKVRGITKHEFGEMIAASKECGALGMAVSPYCQLVGLSLTRRRLSEPRRILFPGATSSITEGVNPVTPSPKRTTETVCMVPTYRDAKYDISRLFLEFTRPTGCSATKFFLVNGVPGCGKTTAISNCLEDLVQRPLWEAFGTKPLVVKINCVVTSNSSSVAAQILEACSEQKSTKLEDISCLVGHSSNRSVLVVVLDEIDFWLSTDNNFHRSNLNDSERMLRQLVLLAADPSRRLCVVAVSNAINGVVISRIKEVAGGKVSFYLYLVSTLPTLTTYRALPLAKDFATVTIPAYRHTDLVEIMKARHPGPASQVQDSVLTFIAMKVSNSKGDARQACSLLCAVSDQWREEKKPTLASVRFAKQIIEQAGSPTQRAIYDGLPTRQKELLAVIAKINSQGKGPATAASITSVYVREMSKRSREDASDAIEYAPVFFSTLKDQGLVSYADTADGYPEDHEPVHLEANHTTIIGLMDRLIGKFYDQVDI